VPGQDVLRTAIRGRGTHVAVALARSGPPAKDFHAPLPKA
jgi:hypothetical protein